MFDPERYESNKSAAARDAEEFVPKLVGYMVWKKNEVIMDYGCGAGSTGAKLILPKVESCDSKMFSVDISKEMLEHAKKAYPSPRISYAVGDILSDDFQHRNMKFDKIFAVHVLHFVKNYREALKRFYDLLQPGGQFGFTVLARSTLYQLHEKLGKDPKWSEYMKGYENYVPQWVADKETAESAFKRNLKEAGFEIVKLTTHNQHYNFNPFETVLDLYLSLNPFIKVIPEALHEAVKLEYREFLADYAKVDMNSESIELDHDLLYAVVRKPLPLVQNT